MIRNTIIIIIISLIVFRALEKEDISHIDELPYNIYGNQESQYLLIFLHGFPNTSGMWSKIVNEVKDEYLCMTISYPNFSDKLKLRWGLEIDKIVELIKLTIDNYERKTKKDYTKIIISHDWGASFTYMFESKYHNYIKEMITIDVGIGRGSFKNKLMIATYQLYVASSFLIGGPIGDQMIKFFYNSFIKPVEYGITEEESKRVDSSWGYLYYYLWKNLYHIKRFQDDYKRKVPIVYLYGLLKPFHFHDEDFINEIKQDKRSELHALNTGHWVMNGNEKFIVDIIKRRNPIK